MDYRDLMIEMCDDGMVDYREALIACLKYMSVDEVQDLMHLNEFTGPNEDEDEEGIPVQDPTF